MKVQTTRQKALNYLCHHGIEGQKWGVKHGPPYPLDDSVSTGNELKKKRRSNREIAKSIRAKKKTGEPLDDEERIYRNTRRAAMIGGPIAGLIAGGITAHKIKKENGNKNFIDTYEELKTKFRGEEDRARRQGSKVSNAMVEDTVKDFLSSVPNLSDKTFKVDISEYSPSINKSLYLLSCGTVSKDIPVIEVIVNENTYDFESNFHYKD